MNKYLLIVIGVIASVLAQMLIKKASYFNTLSSKWILFIILSIGSYALAFIFQAYLMKFFALSRISPIMAIAVMQLVVLSGVIFFGEKLDIKQIIGVVLGSLSIYLILD